MPTEIFEHTDSRSFATGRAAYQERLYTVRGTDDEIEVYTQLASFSPSSVDIDGNPLNFLPRSSISATPLHDDHWQGRVLYGVDGAPSDEPAYTFDTTGGTQRIFHSLETISKTAPPGETAPENHGLIGVTDNGVEGVDIIVPSAVFTETHRKTHAEVTEAYKGTVIKMTGKVNSAPFRGFAAGELLFAGAYGSRRGIIGDWEITYRWAASENQTDISIGNGLFTVPTKKGWEYLWLRIRDVVDAVSNTLTKKPVAAYVERVYRTGDFSLLDIGS